MGVADAPLGRVAAADDRERGQLQCCDVAVHVEQQGRPRNLLEQFREVGVAPRKDVVTFVLEPAQRLLDRFFVRGGDRGAFLVGEAGGAQPGGGLADDLVHIAEQLEQRLQLVHADVSVSQNQPGAVTLCHGKIIPRRRPAPRGIIQK